ncbi:MAG: hypothetical protein LBP83_04500 [Dysgonamonadaceae bacterium]|jgi:hypothetical protein|nr:hypothetical protein [Dysgonamonadaceae bacterium]
MSDIQNSEQGSQQRQTIIIDQQQQSNGAGTAGFVLALLTQFLGWIPVLGWILWLLGLIFSCVGLAKRPRGLAIAGLVLSLISVIVTLVVFAILGESGLTKLFMSIYE